MLRSESFARYALERRGGARTDLHDFDPSCVLGLPSNGDEPQYLKLHENFVKITHGYVLTLTLEGGEQLLVREVVRLLHFFEYDVSERILQTRIFQIQ